MFKLYDGTTETLPEFGQWYYVRELDSEGNLSWSTVARLEFSVNHTKILWRDADLNVDVVYHPCLYSPVSTPKGW